MTGLKTEESLLRSLREASARPVTSEELHAQRVSFIMGTVKAESGITREQVQQVLAKQEGSSQTVYKGIRTRSGEAAEHYRAHVRASLEKLREKRHAAAGYYPDKGTGILRAKPRRRKGLRTK